MDPLLIEEVRAAVGGDWIGRPRGTLTGVSTDSRSVRTGELFIALRGERFDGHDHLEEAARRGAAAAVVEREVQDPPLPLLRTGDTLEALLDLAAHHRRRLSARVVAITGSNGKTTTKELAACALAARYKVVKSPRSYNNFVGLPLTLFQADADTEVVVAELGTSRPGEIDRLARVVRPDVAVITNVAPAHLEGLGTVAGVAREKGALLEHVAEDGLVLLNADDPWSEKLAERARARVETFGLKRRADHVATMPFCALDRIAFHFEGRERVRLRMIGCHNFYNALAALATAQALGVAADRACRALEAFESPPMRLERIRCGDVLLVNDAYNANPGSMKAAIQTLAALPWKGRRLLVLGEMRELGERSPDLHREIGGALSCGSFDLIAVVGAGARPLLDGALQHGVAADRLLWFEDAGACAQGLAPRLGPGDMVLVKGSRAIGLETVVEALERAARRLERRMGAGS